MTRTERLLDQITRVTTGDPWYGSPIAVVLEGITARDAAARPLPNVHTIWELVLHMTGWAREVSRRIREGGAQQPPEGDWPAMPQPSETNWAASKRALMAAHEDLHAVVGSLEEKRLDQRMGDGRDPVLGSGLTVEGTVLGLLQHDAYHLGQIGLVKKGLGARG